MSRRGKTVSALIGADVICALTESRERRCVGANHILPVRLASSEGTPQEMLRPLVAGISALLPRGLPTFSFLHDTVSCSCSLVTSLTSKDE